MVKKSQKTNKIGKNGLISYISVAGPGSRSPIKRDYEPRKILTFHPQIANSAILARLASDHNLGSRFDKM
jgi:hypothetical protein